jgi:ABC-type branched-subunit amino acid transport system substrate-binding protein
MIVVKIKFLLEAILFLLLLAAATVSADPTYKVGVILPLSGEAASVGHAIKNGIDLAYQDLST